MGSGSLHYTAAQLSLEAKNAAPKIYLSRSGDWAKARFEPVQSVIHFNHSRGAQSLEMFRRGRTGIPGSARKIVYHARFAVDQDRKDLPARLIGKSVHHL